MPKTVAEKKAEKFLLGVTKIFNKEEYKSFSDHIILLKELWENVHKKKEKKIEYPDCSKYSTGFQIFGREMKQKDKTLKQKDINFEWRTLTVREQKKYSDQSKELKKMVIKFRMENNISSTKKEKEIIHKYKNKLTMFIMEVKKECVTTEEIYQSWRNLDDDEKDYWSVIAENYNEKHNCSLKKKSRNIKKTSHDINE